MTRVSQRYGRTDRLTDGPTRRHGKSSDINPRTVLLAVVNVRRNALDLRYGAVKLLAALVHSFLISQECSEITIINK